MQGSRYLMKLFEMHKTDLFIYNYLRNRNYCTTDMSYGVVDGTTLPSIRGLESSFGYRENFVGSVTSTMGPTVHDLD